MKVHGKFRVLHPEIEPGTSSAVGKCLNHYTTQLPESRDICPHALYQQLKAPISSQVPKLVCRKVEIRMAISFGLTETFNFDLNITCGQVEILKLNKCV